MYQSLGTRQTPQQKGKDMSTEGLKGIDALRKGLHEHAREVKAKAQETLDEINETNRQKAADLEAADIMRRRLEQEADDRLEELDHVAGQRAYIAFGVRSDESDAPTDPEPPAPVPTPEPEPDPAADNGNADNGDHTRVDTPPVQSEVRRNNGNPRNWRGLAWLLALLGAVIGLIVARVTYEPMWQNVHGGWHSLLVTLWFVALIAAGFFTGGAIGASHEERREAQPAAA